jgi:cytochrome c-type biogenesis protein CcmH/NrfG
MTRENWVFTGFGFLLGLVIGGFLLGPRLARSKLAGTPARAQEEVAAPSTAEATASAPAGAPMAAVQQQIAALRQRIESNPADPEPLVQLGNIYMEVSKLPQAIDYYERALRLRENAEVRTDLGICYKQSGQAEKAAENFERAFRDDPQQWQALYNLAIVRAEARRFDEARAAVARLRAMRPADADVEQLERAIAAMR